MTKYEALEQAIQNLNRLPVIGLENAKLIIDTANLVAQTLNVLKQDEEDVKKRIDEMQD